MDLFMQHGQELLSPCYDIPVRDKKMHQNISFYALYIDSNDIIKQIQEVPKSILSHSIILNDIRL